MSLPSPPRTYAKRNRNNIKSMNVKKGKHDDRIIKGVPIKEYQAIHHWIKKNYGRTTKCENDKCLKISNKFTWALIKGLNYERKRGNFKELCSSCHISLDRTKDVNRRIGLSRLGTKQSLKTIELRVSQFRGKKRPPQVAEAIRKAHSMPVIQLLGEKIVKRYNSLTDIAKYLGMTPGGVLVRIKKYPKAYAGYQYKYE